jgi:hypothetical protein
LLGIAGSLVGGWIARNLSLRSEAIARHEELYVGYAALLGGFAVPFFDHYRFCEVVDCREKPNALERLASVTSVRTSIPQFTVQTQSKLDRIPE